MTSSKVFEHLIINLQPDQDSSGTDSLLTPTFTFLIEIEIYNSKYNGLFPMGNREKVLKNVKSPVIINTNYKLWTTYKIDDMRHKSSTTKAGFHILKTKFFKVQSLITLDQHLWKFLLYL